MNKSAIQKFAVESRRELIKQVQLRAYQYGITESNIGDASASSVDGRMLTDSEKSQRSALIRKINTDGYNQVMEEVAYTWFNRFIALRFMEVNNYLPSHIRVFSDPDGAFKPQIISEALTLELPGLDRTKVVSLIENNDNEALYRYLLLTQCNALNKALPVMFEQMDSYTEILLPNNILRPDGAIGKMISDIPEDDWKDAVQIIGWMYQYYNSELKDDTFAQLKKNVKISKERIPAATQLFTPDWIVRYMVENSIGRIFINDLCTADGSQASPIDEKARIAKEKDIAEHMGWKYYLPEAEQTPEVRAQLTAEHKPLTDQLPTLKVIDPCMGSGHILVYAFDVLMQIYAYFGYTPREAVRSILENNLYGLDIDNRASQLAYFAVMMRARTYDQGVLRRGIQPNIYAIESGNDIDSMVIEYFHNNDPELQQSITSVISDMSNAKEYGSILKITPVDFESIYARFDEIADDISFIQQPALKQLLPLVKCAQTLSQKYDAVITNPPYMGSSGMNAKLSEYIKKNYPDSKSDLFACFIERGFQIANEQGFVSMITMESWMFLSSFEKMRQSIINTHTIVNMVHMPYLGKGGTSLGINFGTTAVIFDKRYCKNYNSQFDYICYYETDENGIPFEFPTVNERYKTSTAANFSKIPGSPVAYWLNANMVNDFSRGRVLKEDGDTRQGMATSDNNRFLRLWTEVSNHSLGLNCASAEDALQVHKKWYPYNKGGEFRKWYGNIDYVINYEDDGLEVKAYATSLYKTATRTIKSMREYFKPCLSWSKISSGSIAFRYYPQGFIFDVAGCCIFYKKDEIMKYHFGFINSNVAKSILAAISPTLNYEAGHIASLPVISDERQNGNIIKLVDANIESGKEDWDSYETSWNFKRNPLL